MSDKNTDTIILPNIDIWDRVTKIALTEDKPIKLDYWLDSLENRVIIGVRENSEKLLVKSEDEYTSPIEKIYKLNDIYILCTENSIYITKSTIQSKRIST